MKTKLELDLEQKILRKQYEIALEMIQTHGSEKGINISSALSMNLLIYQATCELSLKQYKNCIESVHTILESKGSESHNISLLDNQLNYLRLMLATSQDALGEYEETLNTLSRLRKDDSNVYCKALILKASTLLRTGRLIEAREDLIQFDISNKSNVLKSEFYFILGILEYHLNHKVESMAYLTKACHFTADDPNVGHIADLKCEALKILINLKIEHKQYDDVNNLITVATAQLTHVSESRKIALHLEILYLQAFLYADIEQGQALFNAVVDFETIYNARTATSYQTTLYAQLLISSSYLALKIGEEGLVRTWLSNACFNNVSQENFRTERDLAWTILSYVTGNAWDFSRSAENLKDRFFKYEPSLSSAVVHKWFDLVQPSHNLIDQLASILTTQKSLDFDHLATTHDSAAEISQYIMIRFGFDNGSVISSSNDAVVPTLRSDSLILKK
jgi:tetratricopeptide (TPR) repeat protein